MTSDNKRKLYDALSKDYEMGTFEQFTSDISDKTKRRKLYDAISSDYDLPEYSIFERQLGVGKLTSQEKSAGMNALAETMQNARRSSAQAGSVIQRGMVQAKNPLGVQRVVLGSAEKPKVTDNRGVVKTGEKFNAGTGKIEPTYITESGNEYTGSRASADFEQNQIDEAKFAEQHPLEYELKQAYAERDRLEKLYAERDNEVVAPVGFSGGAGTIPMRSLAKMSDSKLKELNAAIRQNDERIRTLEAVRDKGGFWRGFADVLKDSNTYFFGLPGLIDSGAMFAVANKAQLGEKLTTEEEALLRNVVANGAVQGEYGKDASFLYRAGRISGEALPFVAQFAATGGYSAVSKAGAEMGTKMATKAAAKGVTNKAAQWLIKNTGVAVGDIASSVLMANTVGLANTGSDIIRRNMGEVVVDENGDYKAVGGKSIGKAVYEAEVANTLEYYTEKLGNHLQIGNWLAKGAEKIGLSNMSKAINYLSSNKWLDKAGVQDYPTEVIEEEANLLLNSLLVGDNKFSDLWDGRTQSDILGGMFFSIGLLNAPKYINTGYQTAQYFRYKHNTDKADRIAKFRIGDERWEEIKSSIDSADNEQISGVINDIILSREFHEPQKDAAVNYVVNLLKMRGYNTALINSVNDEVQDEAEGALPIDHSTDKAYTDGYNAVEPKDMNDIKNAYENSREKLEGSSLSGLIDEINDTPVKVLDFIRRHEELTEEEKHIAIEYVNAKATYDGMLQRVRNDIDGKIAENDALIDSRVNQVETGGDGMIHPATMSVDDRKVYIISGSVVMHDDGKGVNREKSSASILVRDAETGKIEMVSPAAIFSVDHPINADELKASTAEEIRRSHAQQEADKIDGVLPFNIGNEYSLLADNGERLTVQVLADNGDGTVEVAVNGDTSNTTPMSKETVQAMSDAENKARVRALEVANAVNAQAEKPSSYNLNDEITLYDNAGNPIKGEITMIEDEREHGQERFLVDTGGSVEGKKPIDWFTREELDRLTRKEEDVIWRTPKDATTTSAEGQGLDYVEPSEAETATKGSGITPQKTSSAGKDTEVSATVQEKAEKSAYERIPKDEKGEPLYEQADADTAWDAIVEQAEGDEVTAQAVANDMVADMAAAVKKAERAKSRGGATVSEKIAAERERKEAVDSAKNALAHWKKIAGVAEARRRALEVEKDRQMQEVARARKEQEERERLAKEEAERRKREALRGVPDFIDDKPKDARARGYRRVNAEKIDRQQPLEAVVGKEVQVKFDDNNIPSGHVAVIDVSQLQPSHKNGQRNPLHFIDEAQPKERKDDASVGAARKIASNIRPEEITTSVTAYTGAPTVNGRGETIQGNNRSAALIEMWGGETEQAAKYKQYLIDHAGEFGVTPEQIASMDQPVLVNMLDVSDEEAIALGQYVASDTESGGVERIKPKNVVKKLGEKMKNYTSIILRSSNDEMSLSELIDANGVESLKWLNAQDIITSTQYKSAFDSKGNLTAEAKNDIKGIMYQSIFEGGSTQLEEMFNVLPAKAQKAILATAYRDFDSPASERMLDELQNSIMAYHALSGDEQFMSAKNHKDARLAVESWKRQLAFDDVTGESYLPSAKYSNFALLLAVMYKGDSQSFIQGTFNKMYDLIQGTQEETLFEQPDNTPRSLAEAIKVTLNIEYDGTKRSNVLVSGSSASQERERGSNGDIASGGRGESGDGRTTDRGGSDDAVVKTDSQGNLLNEDGILKIEKISSIDEITDEDFSKPTRSVELPALPKNVDEAIGANGKPVIIKKNIFEKNWENHKFPFDESRTILKAALYDTDLIGQTQPSKKPMHWVAIKLDDKSPIVILEVNEGKENIEIVGWYTLDERNLERIKRQAIKNGGELVILSSKDKVESLSTPLNELSSGDKVTESSQNTQEKADKNVLTERKEGEDLFSYASRIAEADQAGRKRKAEEAKVNTTPTDGQKEAGNYKKGHIVVDGHNITIEQPKGSVRTGKDKDGKEWRSEMHHTYGYIRGTESVDGDHIDIFISDNPLNGNVFVVDQVNKDGSFDEHKVMYGFGSMEEAKQAYLSNYEDGWQGLGNITEVSKDEFKKWIDSSKRKTKPFAEYKSVKTESAQSKEMSQPTMTEEEAMKVIGNMKANATVAPYIEITEENWKENIETPIGNVIIGANQKDKLFAKGRRSQYGMLVETLSNPDIVLEERDKEENFSRERSSSCLFIKTFQKEYGSKYVHFESVTVSQQGMEISVSSHIINENALKKKLKESEMLYKKEALFSNSSEMHLAEHQKDVPDLLPTQKNNVSTGKDSKNQSTVQRKPEEIAENSTWRGRYDALLEEAMGELQAEMPEETITAEDAKANIDFNKESDFYQEAENALGSERVNEIAKEIIQKDKDKVLSKLTVDNILNNHNGHWQHGDAVYDFSYFGFWLSENESKKGTYDLTVNTKWHNGTSYNPYYTQEFNGLSRAQAEELMKEAAEKEMGVGGVIVPLSRLIQELQSNETAAQKLATNALLTALDNAGIPVDIASEEQAEAMLSGENGIGTERQVEIGKLEKASSFISSVLAGTNKAKGVKVDIPFIVNKLAEKAVGHPIKTHSIRASEIVHSKNRHGLNGTANGVNSIPLRDDDFALMPYIMTAPTRVVKGSRSVNGTESVRYEKELSNGIVVVVEREGRFDVEDMENITMWAEKKPATNVTVADKTSHSTSETIVISEADIAKIRKDAEEAIRNDVKNIEKHIVYHGSGAKFNQFDHSHMGEGEGVQAYGWGSYVTEVEGIGRTYAEAMLSDRYRENRIINTLAKERIETEGSKEGALKYLRYILTEPWSDKKRVKAQIKIIETGKFLPGGKSQLYTVDIPDDTGNNYLYYGKNYADVRNGLDTDKLKSALYDEILATDEVSLYGSRQAQRELKIELDDKEWSFVQDIYGNISSYLGSDEKASKFFSKLGYVGISYPAQYRSGGRSDGSRNYVIFNESDLKIIERVEFMRTGGKKKSAPETASPVIQDHSTVVSSADGAKVLNNLDNAIKTYENRSTNRTKTFIGDVAKALDARKQGSGSEYATFETKSGILVTIRLANHNAKVSTFDNHEEDNGISIVLSNKGNSGIVNDGNANIKEFYYPEIKLNRADGKPLVEILKGIKQSLYSGEYKDTTGLAEVQEVNASVVDERQSVQGTVYGWTVGGKIYLTKAGLNPNTPIHEYTHIWANAMMHNNSAGWNSIKELLKDTPVWNEVVNDENYSDIKGDEDAVASEVLSRISGKENAKKMESEAQKLIDETDGILEKAEAVTLLSRMKKALQKFWYWVGKELFGITKFDSVEEVTDRILYDLVNGTELKSSVHDGRIEKSVSSKPIAEEPRTKRTSKVKSLVEGSLFSDAFFNSDGDLKGNSISSMSDNDLLQKIGEGENKDWNFYISEYDRRHDKEFLESADRYLDSLESEQISLDDAYGMYAGVSRQWSAGGYHGAERTSLRAQIEALEDYINRRESEVIANEVENETATPAIEKRAEYVQNKEAIRNVGFDLTRLRMRELEYGEISHVERRYTESKAFTFTGKEHIESAEDLAYIFRQLETSSVENSFVVLIKDGTPTVIHLAMGSYAQTLAPIEHALVAYQSLNPDNVVFVHNHPSGSITASQQDMDVQKKVEELYGSKALPGIIINTTTGLYGRYSSGMELPFGRRSADLAEGEFPIKVYQFRQQVFSEDWDPEMAFKGTDSKSIAEYVSSHRLGSHKKMSLIVIDQAGHITGNIFLPWTRLKYAATRDGAELIASYVNQMGGRSAVIYGNYVVGENEENTNAYINKIALLIKKHNISLFDVLNLERSAQDNHVMEQGAEYGVSASEPIAGKQTSSLDEVNSKFNEELQQQIDGTLPIGHIYSLGMPSDILLSTGIANAPIELNSTKLMDKSSKFGHDYELSEIRDLVKSLNNPIAIFAYGNKEKAQNLIIGIQSDNKNFVIGLSIRPTVGGKVLEINSIRNVFPKDNAEWLNWINQGKLLYVDKEKIQTLIDQQRTNLADVEYLDLDSATKVIESFENPKLSSPKSESGMLYRDTDAIDVMKDMTGAKGYGINSSYVTGTTADGKSWLIRVSDHVLNDSNLSNHEEDDVDYVLSIVVNGDFDSSKVRHDSFHNEEKGHYQYVLSGDEIIENKDFIEAMISRFKENGTDPWLSDITYRGGNGSYSDSELSIKNDPYAKMLGKSNRTEKQRKEFVYREHQRMLEHARQLAEKLNLDNVEFVTDASKLEGKQATAKGFFSKSSGKITIVVANHRSTEDITQTLLHEAVAHYGLRKLFGEHFDTFLDNVFQNAEPSVRKEIVSLASKNGWDFRTATEEYLASLAEDINFERAMYSGWWAKIKQWFMRMLHDIGFEGFDIPISDNELRYILWRSFMNLTEPGRYRSILGTAEDVAKQYELKVGNYRPVEDSEKVASPNVESLEEANERFNAELDAFKNNEHSGLLHLGQPQAILRKCGIDVESITLSPSVLHNKLKQHNLSTDDLKNLASAIQEPILVYKHGLNHPNIAVVTSLDVRGGKLSISLILNENGQVIDVSNISSVHSKDAIIELERLSALGVDGLRDALRWVDKEKVSDWLNSASLYGDRSMSNPKLDSATKIIESFENPQVSSEKVSEENVLFRNGDPEIRQRVEARELYEKKVRRTIYQIQESLQDSMLSLKEGMNIIAKAEGKKVNIEDVEGFENAYLGENRLSSVNKAEADAFAHLVFKPMLDEVAKLAKNEEERRELTDYMMAKHGLERNEVMAERNAKELYDAYTQEHPNGGKTFDDFYNESRERDYAGLTALTGVDDVVGAEAEASKMVSDYEAKHNAANLWKKVNTVTDAILSKSYESGMMSKDTYAKIKGMYSYYIPLRGFDEKTSAEAYAYLSNRSGSFNSPIKTAKGRSSKADDPFAHMEIMAENAIMQGNRNTLVKQRFLNFVLNHPSDLVSVSDLWLKYDEVTEEWVSVFPDNISEKDSAGEVEQKMRDFEERMKMLADQSPSLYKRGKDAVNIPYRVVESRDLQQHQVIVKRGGRDYVLTINGNPRLAQALNGLTNPDNDITGAIGLVFRFGEKVNRQLSAFYTTRNPDFVVSNFIRDMLYSNSMVWVKESPSYALRFHNNVTRCNPAQMAILLSRHRKGELDMSDKFEYMFHQFMMNGGETGYTNIRDIEKHKNDISRELKRANGKLGVAKAWNLLGERLDEYNRAVENCARFAAFLTSREMGRSIDRAIWDAKEISVNFNKKGSGAKFMGANGQTFIGNAAAFASAAGRSCFVFWNAAIQGTTNFGRQYKRHPAKAFTTSAVMFLLGAVIAGLGMDGDDDDDEKNSYWNIPEYVRRSNIMFRAGDHWISIPLPVEYRALYGMGELMTSVLSGNERLTDLELGKAIAGQATQILPIDFLEGSGGMGAFLPSWAKPFAEAHSNKSWTGIPVYKETEFNTNMPEWTKAYKGANKHLVNLTKALSEATGGDAYTKGVLDFNPAQIEYVLNGYFGGVATTIDKLCKSAETIAGQREYDPRSFLLLNRVVKKADERTEARAINNAYFRLQKEAVDVKRRLRNYEHDTDNGIFDYAEKIDFLYNSPEYRRYEVYEKYRYDIEALYEEAKDIVDTKELSDIELEIIELKKEFIREATAIR